MKTSKSKRSKPSKPSKPRSMASKQAIVKAIRSTATRICLENGVDDETDIKILATCAVRDIKKMQVAGVKASLKKKLGHGSPKFWTKR